MKEEKIHLTQNIKSVTEAEYQITAEVQCFSEKNKPRARFLPEK